jgi:hypothetical protein
MMFFVGKPVAEPNSSAIRERRTMTRANLQYRLACSPALHSAPAATSFAIALIVWYAEPWPGILAVVLNNRTRSLMHSSIFLFTLPAAGDAVI